MVSHRWTSSIAAVLVLCLPLSSIFTLLPQSWAKRWRQELPRCAVPLGLNINRRLLARVAHLASFYASRPNRAKPIFSHQTGTTDSFLGARR